ncbi:MAG: CPBP family intramembrane metalloprotease [Pseudomonadales bacterium]|nr:CPBP family intramembrane metalloprotease [Pseudomonadales bacterium]MCP5186096.1 CPBP family intramembrane metalloprotease [Pseudomonadales bacterium]
MDNPSQVSGARVAWLLLAYFAVALLAGTLLAWPVWRLVDFPFDKVLTRVALLVCAVLLVPLLRQLGLNWRAIGFRGFAMRPFIAWWCLGVALILPPALLVTGVGYRVPDLRALAEPMEVARVAMAGLTGGMLAALLEEALFRGVMLTAFQRLGGTAFALVLSSFLYALVHFVRVRDTPVAEHWWSGLALAAGAFSKLAEPALLWDSFVSLFLLGVLLCLVRLRCHSLYPAIALHAAWVFFLRVYKDITVRDMASAWQWLVGTYDAFNGIAVSVWLLLLLAVLLVLNRAGRVPVWR